MIGIFQYKKAVYNQKILKSLVYGPKNTQQIAEYIYRNRSIVPLNNLNKNEVKKIVSTISRHTDKQKGRLCELETKGYIFREESLWKLSRKGVCVALTLFNSIQDVFPFIRMDIVGNIVEEEFLGNREFKRLLNRYLPKEKVKNIFEVAKSPEILQLWKDYTNELIANGLDLDGVDNEQFTTLMVTKGMANFFKPDLTRLNKTLKEYADRYPK